MADITKQSYEEFRIDVDFGLNMETGEALVVGSCTVVCEDKDGEDVTTTLLDDTTKKLVTGSSSALANGGLQVLIKGGSEAAEPYKYTFKGVTDLDPANKWEKDVTMRIRER
jgi:hypothetical protein